MNSASRFMHHRYDKSNIPIELLRTLVAISDTGSFTKAADALGLSQSAVSLQIKRLERLVAGELFRKSGSGHRLTEHGQVVAGYALRVLALNDQILALAGSDPKVRQIRLGIPAGFDEELLVNLVEALSPAHCGEIIQLRSELQDDLLRGLELGHLDLAFIVDTQQPMVAAVEWSEKLYWVRSPKFLLSPGAPVPLISSPGSLSDRTAIRAFERANIPYCVAFVGHDRGLRKAAVLAGLGVMVAVERSVTAAKLNVANDHYLPPLQPVRGGIYLREGLAIGQVQKILGILESILNPAAAGLGATDPNRLANVTPKTPRRRRP
jgi:DNA-binding transcriptional LysR family regulator